MSAKKESITVGKNTVQISGLTVEDQATAQILSDKKSEEREEFLIKSIKIGTNVQINQVPIEKMDYVKNEFKDLLMELERRTGEWDDLITDTMEGSLDPEKEGKPINKLRTRILEGLSEIKKAIDQKEERKVVMEGSAAKGEPFEEEIERAITDIKSINDSVEGVGKMNVGKSRRKVGDVLITVKEPRVPEFKIIVEVKAGADFSLTGKNPLKKQLSDSMALRGARGGIAVVKQKHMQRRQKVWEDEGSNRLIVAVDVNELEDKYDFALIEVAYRVMRNRIIQSFDTSDVEIPDIDTVVVENLVKEILESLEIVKGLKSNCTTVITTTTNIQNQISDLKREIDSSVREILALLK